MKTLSLIIVSFFFVQCLTAQTDSCKVLLEKISGQYAGKCLNGLANGEGKSIGEDTFIGIFKDGLPHGKGKYLYKNGDIFQGYWKNGQKDGKGKFNYLLNGEKYTLIGYWIKDEYIGETEPEITYKVTSASGILKYLVENKSTENTSGNDITISINSTFNDYIPRDLKIENSSGQIVQSGRRFIINQYSCPLHCEISYTILIGEISKQCRFIIDIYEEANYTISLSND